MTKKTIILLVVISILMIINFTSLQVSAKRIDNTVPLDPCPPTEELPSVIIAPFAGFEIGDCIFREMLIKVGNFELKGHAGLYWHWAPSPGQITPDPNRWEDQITMEAKLLTKMRGQLMFTDFKEFHATSVFWGVGAHKLDYRKRQQLVEIAKTQTFLHPRYTFRAKYKTPGKFFRCDGFVEWCYEQVGIDIVPNDWWRPRKGRTGLSPALQWQNSATRIGKFQELRFGTEENPDEVMCIDEKVVPLKDGRYTVWGEKPAEVKIYANDLDENNDGSGITRLELWIGEPDDTPDEMPGYRLLEDDDNYPADNEYTCTWDIIEFPNGDYTLKAIAFDQAGNTATTSINVRIEQRTVPAKIRHKWWLTPGYQWEPGPGSRLIVDLTELLREIRITVCGGTGIIKVGVPGQILITNEREYSFTFFKNVKHARCQIVIDDDVILDFEHTGDGASKTATVYLTKGYHSFLVHLAYHQWGSYCGGMILTYDDGKPINSHTLIREYAPYEVPDP